MDTPFLSPLPLCHSASSAKRNCLEQKHSVEKQVPKLPAGTNAIQDTKGECISTGVYAKTKKKTCIKKQNNRYCEWFHTNSSNQSEASDYVN